MRKAIVMGATSGIGMEVAKLLAGNGWQVGIAGRRVERLEALTQEVNERSKSKDFLGKAIAQGEITSYKVIDVTSPNAPLLLLELSRRWAASTFTSIAQALDGRTTPST